MSMFKNMESIIKVQGERGLDNMLHYYGIDLDVLRPSVSDASSKIHGKRAGGPVKKVGEIIGILESDDFLPSNSGHSGAFEMGFLYTRGAVKVGDTIAVQSEDGKSRKFKIDEKQSIGLTTEVFTKYSLSALAK